MSHDVLKKKSFILSLNNCIMRKYISFLADAIVCVHNYKFYPAYIIIQ